jgi:hypothetical protein
MVRQSYTAILERDALWENEIETEPYEAGWASEAIFFIRTMSNLGAMSGMRARVQVSPDGIQWCDEGTAIAISAEPGLTFARVSHFGGWLRLSGDLPPGASVRVLVALALKE